MCDVDDVAPIFQGTSTPALDNMRYIEYVEAGEQEIGSVSEDYLYQTEH